MICGLFLNLGSLILGSLIRRILRTIKGTYYIRVPPILGNPPFVDFF